MPTIIRNARNALHNSLVRQNILAIEPGDVPTNADAHNEPSRQIALRMAHAIGATTAKKLPGQTSGMLFECAIRDFLLATFPHMQHLRPGDWGIEALGNRSRLGTSDFAQYAHLSSLAQIVNANRELQSALGNDYMVAPDIVVFRNLCDDNEINQPAAFVDANSCNLADLRKANGGKPILHASISAKWTMRSDRAQNSRTEALNLIRNRKGCLPHIVVVTGEPLPSRLASIALGTGDLDCVYHFALYELLDAVRDYASDGREDILETLETLIEGKRLKDISDLPLDLSV